jgi:formylglycine-generating enzyme required for sulfatase activity/serine/threonine protein kinase
MSPAISEGEPSLEDVVLAYFKAGDAGQPQDPRTVLAHHPAIAVELREFFAVEEELAPLLSPLRVLPLPGPPQVTGAQLVPDTPEEAGQATTATDVPPAIPGYEVLGIQGKGGMGIVYKARQISLNRIVALKVIRSQRLQDPGARVRFQAEARAVARLHHPNILQVWDHGEHECQPYLSLEYLDAGTLADWRKESPRSPQEVATLVALLADAVEHAHQQGIVHRDLKPANILLTTEGVPKVGDFGLARATQSEEAGLTRPGDAVGTPLYMAPEQAEGHLEEVGPWTDVFGLGAVLYELLTRQPPYRGTTIKDVIEQARQARIKAPRQFQPRVPRALEGICLKALAADPHQRHPSAAALAADLRRYLHAPRVRPWAAGSAVACLLLAGLAFWLLGWQPGGTLPSDPPTTGSVRAPVEPPSSKPPEPAPRPTSPEELAARARTVLQNNCYRCHGKDGAVESGLNYVLDPPRLLARRLIVKGQPEASPLFQRVKNREMPPGKAKPRPSDEEVAVLEEWIRAGAPDFNPQVARRFLTAADVLGAIRNDLEKAHRKDREFFRYFTITHLYNAGLPEDGLQTYRFALSKLANSLSREPEITTPVAIDPQRTIFRIDLRDYQWTDTVWARLLAEYPYGVTYRTETAKYCYNATRCQLPHVRADWFVFEASKPPLYHEILQLPATDTELEAQLGINVTDNRRGEDVVRAGFNKSGVAVNNNRMIERHPYPRDDGAYWKSFDFRKPGGRGEDLRNIKEHPLGPGPEAGAFRHDGGEIIFNLPNGLQAYMLVNGKGERINKGDTDLVIDPNQREKAVINGISCMSCHTRGMRDAHDEVRGQVEDHRLAYHPDVYQGVMRLYKKRGVFKQLLDKDTERFARAVKAATGMPPTGTDPIVALASRYDWELDGGLAAAEAGLEKGEFLKELARSKELGRLLGPLQNEGGTVQRAAWANRFADVVRELRPEEGQPFKPPNPVPIKAEEGVIQNSIGMKLRRIPAGKFLMGTPGEKNTEELPHEVRITRPFFIGVYEVTQEEFQQVMSTNPSHFSRKGEGKDAVKDIREEELKRFPVESVSWDDAVKFCKKLSALELAHGRVYRLPTEAEWEYACRAGSKSAYTFGDGPAQLNEHAWYAANSQDRTHSVGQKKPNAWGLHDMHGNVREWCGDYYDETYYRKSVPQDPAGPEESPLPERVLRGGSYEDQDRGCRSADRSSSIQNFENGTGYGFRVVLVIDDKAP